MQKISSTDIKKVNRNTREGTRLHGYFSPVKRGRERQQRSLEEVVKGKRLVNNMSKDFIFN